MNRSIDVNTDQLKLSTTGLEPNIISYRKPDQNDNPNRMSSTQKIRAARMASAKIRSSQQIKMNAVELIAREEP